MTPVEITEEIPIPVGDGETLAEMRLWCSKWATYRANPAAKWNDWLGRFHTFTAWLACATRLVDKGYLLSMPEPKETTLAESLESARARGKIGVRIYGERGELLAEYLLPEEVGG